MSRIQIPESPEPGSPTHWSRGPYLILADVCIADGSASILHGLLEVGTGDAGDRVNLINILLHRVRVVSLGPLALDVLLNILSAG